tara:strand:+ start:1190 stop:1393 length:204 start_codon:yes stop_codon:yes gene_type:complete
MRMNTAKNSVERCKKCTVLAKYVLVFGIQNQPKSPKIYLFSWLFRAVNYAEKYKIILWKHSEFSSKK